MASSEPADVTTLTDYRRRFEVEEGFKDDKAGGFQLQHSRLLDPDAHERLLLCLALATLYLTSIGTSVVAAQRQHWVDPHGQRSLSYLQLGARWRRQQVQRGWQGFPAFQLDPAPDPLPLPALHCEFITLSDQDDLTPAA